MKKELAKLLKEFLEYVSKENKERIDRIARINEANPGQEWMPNLMQGDLNDFLEWLER